MCQNRILKDVRYSKAQKMLKCSFNALIQWLLHHPTMFHTATVRPKRSGPSILYNTSLSNPGPVVFAHGNLHQVVKKHQSIQETQLSILRFF